jgi:nitroreductase
MTNEEYLIAIDKRCSRRTFRNIPLDEDTKAVIRDMVEYVNRRDEIHFIFVEDARYAFNSQTGNMSLIAVCGRDTIPARELCGNYGETIVLQCAFHGLGTCWVGTYNENKLMEQIDIPDGYRLYCVIAVGLVSPDKA